MTKTQALDRHALVTTVWLSAGLVATTLFHYGLGRGGGGWIVAAFGVVVAAFAGHVIVNAIHHTPFGRREVALGLVLYGVALVAFGVATLASSRFAARAFAPASVGFLLVFVAVVFTMITRTGVRGAFEAFDVIRTFRARSRRDSVGEGNPAP